MTTKVKPLTQTQINAICKKLKREFDPTKVKTGRTTNEMCNANAKFITTLIDGLKIPTPLKKFLKEDKCEFINDCMSKKEMKELGVPYPDPFAEAGCEYDIQRKHDAMIEELKFELTMATAGDYKQLMDTFRAQVKKAFAK